MQQILSVLVLLVGGALFLCAAHVGSRNGRVRAGNSFLRVHYVERDESPLAFRFCIAMYYCLGMGMCVWGLLAMVGMAPPLKWR